MMKTITLDPNIPTTRENEETQINNPPSFPSVSNLKNQDSLISQSEKKLGIMGSSFHHYKKNIITDSIKKMYPFKKEESIKIDTLHNLTRYEQGFISSPCTNLIRRFTTKGSKKKSLKLEPFLSVSSRAQHKEDDTQIKTRFPFEFNIKIITTKMNAFNFEFKIPISQAISFEDMQIYNEIRYIMWMRPELSANSFNVEDLVKSVTSKLLKEQCNTRTLLIEWLRIYTLLYKNYKFLKNTFLSYNMGKKEAFEEGFLMKFDCFQTFCIDTKLNNNKIYEAFFLSSRYDKNIGLFNLEDLKQSISAQLVSEISFDDYIKEVVLSPSEDNYINLSGFLECIVRMASLTSENELVSESIERVMNCNIKTYAKSTLSILYNEIYESKEIEEIVAHYDDSFRKVFIKFKIKNIYNFENQIYNTQGAISIKEFEYFLRQLKMLKSLVESRITEKKIVIIQPNILVNGYSSNLKYVNFFNIDELSLTDDERISQNQMFDLFTFVIDDTKAYVKCKEKLIESELRMTYSEFVKAVSLIAIKFWCTLYKFENIPIKEGISEILHKNLEKLGIDTKKII